MTDGLTELRINLRGELVDEDGNVYAYDGVVYCADEVDYLLERKDSEIARLRGLLSRLDMQASEEQRNAAYNRLFRQKGAN